MLKKSIKIQKGLCIGVCVSKVLLQGCVEEALFLLLEEQLLFVLQSLNWEILTISYLFI